jgi:hypothetical protein
MKLLISILDFPDFTAFSKNIAATLVDPYIREAQTFDVKLPTVIREELATTLPLIDKAFKPEDFDTANFPAAAVEAGWQNPKLARVWYEGIRPLLVLESARRMLLIHGVHFTPNGVQTISDGGQMPISSQLRAELRADLQAKANHYRPFVEAGLRALSAITVPTTCGPVRRRRGHGGLQTSAI